MRVFDTTGRWSAKVNFVDRNNVLVGYDMSQNCCEHADWMIAESPAATDKDGKQDWPVEHLEQYAFDVATPPVRDSVADLDAGGSISFRLTAEGLADLWLTLFNSHNGYYSHGFTLDVGGKRAIEESL